MRGAGWRFWGLCVGAGVLSILTGCASITHGSSQTVKIETLAADGKVVTGAKCQLTNERNDLVMRSGESTTVRRAGAALNIECTQPGFAPASGQAISRVNAGMVGNILFGGAIGAVVDSSTGAGFNYPTWMQLVFGEARIFDRSAQTSDQALAGVRIGDTKLASAAPASATVSPSAAAAPIEEKSPATPAVPVVVASTAAEPVPAPSPQSPEAARTTDARVSMDDLGALLPAKP